MEEFLKKEYESLLADGSIDNCLYDKFDVKRGLRNNNGTGVLVGLTKVSDVAGYYMDGDIKKPMDGILYYRGYDIKDIVKMNASSFKYEAICFLLLFGHYPNKMEEEEFRSIISSLYELPKDFLENIILKNPSKSLMNHISRSILSLYSFDESPDAIDPFSLVKKGLSIIAKLPAIICYSYQAKRHYIDKESLAIHFPKREYSLAENILYMARATGSFSELEAKTLDMCLVVHADHGGGNNSTFTGTVVASTLTDIYSMLAASMASLKGPRHGGANIRALDMMNEVIKDIGLNPTDSEIDGVIDRILNKDFYDNSGLIYGLGHAVYTKSDPRCELLKEKARLLSVEKHSEDRFKLYTRFEEIAKRKLSEKARRAVCSNVDFYSGLIYDFLNIPRDLFIPIFATARMVGWISHDIEALLYSNKIIRPATKYVGNIKGECNND